MASANGSDDLVISVVGGPDGKAFSLGITINPYNCRYGGGPMPRGCSDIAIVNGVLEEGQLTVDQLLGFRLVRVITPDTRGAEINFPSTAIIIGALKHAIETQPTYQLQFVRWLAPGVLDDAMRLSTKWFRTQETRGKKDGQRQQAQKLDAVAFQAQFVDDDSSGYSTSDDDEGALKKRLKAMPPSPAQSPAQSVGVRHALADNDGHGSPVARLCQPLSPTQQAIDGTRELSPNRQSIDGTRESAVGGANVRRGTQAGWDPSSTVDAAAAGNVDDENVVMMESSPTQGNNNDDDVSLDADDGDGMQVSPMWSPNGTGDDDANDNDDDDD